MSAQLLLVTTKLVLCLLTFANGRFLLQESEYCVTEGCRVTEKIFLENMNSSVKPCNNYYFHTCGKYRLVHPVPPDQISFNQFSEVTNKVLSRMKDILESPPFATLGWTPEMSKAQSMYFKCLETEESSGYLAAELAKLGGYPQVVGEAWDENAFDVIGTLALMNHVGNQPLIAVDVMVDQKNTTRNIIQIDQGKVPLLRNYYVGRENFPGVFQLYELLLVEIALILDGTNSTRLLEDIADIIDFETLVANITATELDRQNSTRNYNLMNIADLQLLTDPKKEVIDWLGFLRMVVQDNDIIETEEIVVNEVSYLINLIPLMKNATKRQLANVILWNFIMAISEDTFGRVNQKKFDFEKARGGPEEPESKTKFCVKMAEKYFGNAIGRVYVMRYVTPNDRMLIHEMIENIQDAFIKRLENVDFMDNETKEIAVEKVRSMRKLIGFPDWIMDDMELHDYYESMPEMTAPHFFNIIWGSIAGRIDQYGSLRDEHSLDTFYVNPTEVGAFYVQPANSITIPAGIMQMPFFNGDRPAVYNYGAIGSIIGHEITHGFDNDGRKYDKDGNLKNWWPDDVVKHFTNESQCFVEQYGKYCPLAINKTELICVNGEQTLGENIADNGGIESAFQAWKTLQHRQGDNQKLLAFENSTSDQMFFVTFANVWCESHTVVGLESKVVADEHSPEVYRVIGTVSNSPEFAATYNCPVGKMYRGPDKCVLW